MTHRVSVDLPDFSHANPIPAASRIGPFLATGVLTARDQATGRMPESLEDQCATVFARIDQVMTAAGGSSADILKLTFWLQDYRNRSALNREWLSMFPDEASRPARQVVAAGLDGGCLIQCDLFAVLSGPSSGATP